jgi:hypothetical protein
MTPGLPAQPTSARPQDGASGDLDIKSGTTGNQIQSGEMLYKSGLARVWDYAVGDGVPRRSLLVALVVGTVLNLINQGDAFFGASSVNWLKITLTYAVPYFVSTYGAVSYRLSTSKDDAER